MAERPKLGELLLEAGVIDEAQLLSALGEHERWGRPLGATLLQMGFLDEETLVRTLARQLAVPIVWLRGRTVRRDILGLVPRELAVKHRCLPVLIEEQGGRTLLLAMADPSDLSGSDEVSFTSGLPVKPVLAAPSELDEAIARHYPEPEASESELFEGEARFLGSDARDAPPELLSPPGAASAPEAAARVAPAEVETILRALAQILIEKGILTRDELVERVRRLGEDGGAT